MKKFSTILLFCLLIGQFLSAQKTYVGNLDLNKKEKMFLLFSGKDSIKVSIDNKNIEFNSNDDFQLIRIEVSSYKLVCNGDTLVIDEKGNQIDYSSGLSFSIAKKKAHQIVLNDKSGNIILDAKSNMKGSVADFNISIFDKTIERELLSYSTYYLYTQSVNEVNFVPVYMFFMY